MGCNKWKENGSALSIEKWKIVIDGLRDLRCRDIFYNRRRFDVGLG